MHPRAEWALTVTTIVGATLTGIGALTHPLVAYAGVCVAALGLSMVSTMELLAPDAEPAD
jgi:hypothetical protein